MPSTSRLPTTPHIFGEADGGGPTIPLGHFRAADGSEGAPVALDVDRPHVAMVVGKRGSGKSNTLGVIAEGLATTDGVAPVIVDPMGEFDGLVEGVPTDLRRRPQVRPTALDPVDWCRLLDVDPAGTVGGLIWRVADEAPTLAAMRRTLGKIDAAPGPARAARNHLRLAGQWNVFDSDGLSRGALRSSAVTVLDLSTYDVAPAAAVLQAVGTAMYAGAAADETGPLPWLLVDEAAAVTTDVARPAIRQLTTRGRTPGASLVLATQRPGSIPTVAVSQADLLVAHRLTADADIDALATARPTYLDGAIRDRLPRGAGDALVVDDATERATTVTVRARRTPHGGETPRSSDRAAGGTAAGERPNTDRHE